jgi:hypothetical protein
MALAEKGDDSVLTTYMRELVPPKKPGDDGDSYDGWPHELRIFSFGKSVGIDISKFLLIVER